VAEEVAGDEETDDLDPYDDHVEPEKVEILIGWEKQ
jgi:hypothetical protein